MVLAVEHYVYLYGAFEGGAGVVVTWLQIACEVRFKRAFVTFLLSSQRVQRRNTVHWSWW